MLPFKLFFTLLFAIFFEALAFGQDDYKDQSVAVMNDKMNTMYLGLDNPITVVTCGNWNKRTVRVDNGSISGSGSERTVRPSEAGRLTVYVELDNKTHQFNYRVKKIPDPRFKVGPGGTRMPAVTFKNQQYCRAELENFEFDLKYTIVSADVYFSGAGFPETVIKTINSNNLSGIMAEMSRCQPGSAVSFENVKVSGPDGVRSISGTSIVIY